MTKSRTQLIKDIKQARKDAKANLLYVKGLTKMKKEELKHIYDELEHIDKRRSKHGDNEPEKGMVYVERKENLEDEIEKIKEELNNLEDEEDDLETKKIELDELEPDEYEKKKTDDDKDNDDSDSEVENIVKKYIKKASTKPKPCSLKTTSKKKEESEDEEKSESEQEQEQEQEQEPEQPKLTIKQYEHDIMDMMDEYADIIHELLLEYDDVDDLSARDVKDIKKYQDEQRNIIKHNLETIYRQMPRNKDFSERFYNKIENAFAKQDNKVNLFIK